MRPKGKYREYLPFITRIWAYTKYIGIPVYGGNLAMSWAIILLSSLVCLEACAIWKLVRALTGISVYTTAGRSLIGRLSGSIFYANAITSLILNWKFVSAWKEISCYWLRTELSSGLRITPDRYIKKRISLILKFAGVCACVEHIMSMVSAIGFDYCSLDECFKRYILLSHGFLLRPQEYTLWFAVPIFFLSKLATVLWNIQDLVIILISVGLTSRYCTLNNYTCSLVKRENRGYFLQVNFSTCYNTSTWRKLRQAYANHANLIRLLANRLGPLILLSNMNNLYFICLQLYFGIKIMNRPWISRLYYIMSLGWLLFRACSVVLAGADVSLQSQRSLPHLRSCRSSVYNKEIKRLICQLSHDEVALSGLGLFVLSRQTLLGVVAAILKYELILLQYDK
ncbi:gustatory receptor for sugar taste 64a-like [Battus philenor]|uniref:gustatory receptor for sugar taste 64a-like n=1 Tax=Battus philenor TaxID=42288 RepID=UPI0035CFC535